MFVSYSIHWGQIVSKVSKFSENLSNYIGTKTSYWLCFFSRLCIAFCTYSFFFIKCRKRSQKYLYTTERPQKWWDIQKTSSAETRFDGLERDLWPKDLLDGISNLYTNVVCISSNSSYGNSFFAFYSTFYIMLLFM